MPTNWKGLMPRMRSRFRRRAILSMPSWTKLEGFRFRHAMAAEGFKDSNKVRVGIEEGRIILYPQEMAP